MTQIFKAEFNTRLLYSQKYSTEDDVHVSSSMYAVMWGLHASTPLTTTRLRLTCLYNLVGSSVQPIQGLIEQWKNDGWVIVDEFVDIGREFDDQKEFESQLMSMGRSFLLGIPIDSSIISDDDASPPPKGTKVIIPSLTSRLDNLIKKDSKVPEVFKDAKEQPSVKEDEVAVDDFEEEVVEPAVNNNQPKKKEEDSDDDDGWL